MDESREKEKITLLEPDAASSAAITASLQAAGYDVAAFAASAEALQSARTSHADVLILAFPSGSADARELLATIRGAAPSADARVILLVGPDASQRTAALVYGADDALS